MPERLETAKYKCVEVKVDAAIFSHHLHPDNQVRSKRIIRIQLLNIMLSIQYDVCFVSVIINMRTDSEYLDILR